MLPPGHTAAGYLVAYSLLKIAKPELPTEQINQLLLLGAFFGFSPDLDMFVAFAKAKAFTFSEKYVSHRRFYSHAPVLWLIPGLIIYFLATSVFIKYVGLLLWLGSWSHFIIDSVQYGIMWLWPFSSNVYALKDQGIDLVNKEKGFFKYWLYFLRLYKEKFQITFYLEILIILLAIKFVVFDILKNSVG